MSGLSPIDQTMHVGRLRGDPGKNGIPEGPHIQERSPIMENQMEKMENEMEAGVMGM